MVEQLLLASPQPDSRGHRSSFVLQVLKRSEVRGCMERLLELVKESFCDLGQSEAPELYSHWSC